MKLFNLLTIAFLIGAAPFLISLDRGVEFLNTIYARQEVLTSNERQAPQYLDYEVPLDASETQATLTMD